LREKKIAAELDLWVVLGGALTPAANVLIGSG
jgi:hypothetical protein